MKIAIYGMFDGDRCRYVGRSENPNRRAVQHRERFKNAKLKILQWVHERSASSAEGLAIKKYKSIGQAEANRCSHIADTLAIGAKIKAGKDFWVGTNLERKAAIAAAGFMGVKITTQKQVLQPGGFNIYFV